MAAAPRYEQRGEMGAPRADCWRSWGGELGERERAGSGRLVCRAGTKAARWTTAVPWEGRSSPLRSSAFVTFSKWPTWLGITITIKQDGWGLTTNTVAVSSRMSAIKHEAREALTFPLFEMNGDINIHCFVALTSDVLRSPSPLLIYYF